MTKKTQRENVKKKKKRKKRSFMTEKKCIPFAQVFFLKMFMVLQEEEGSDLPTTADSQICTGFSRVLYEQR